MRRGGGAAIDRIGRLAHQLQLELRLAAQLLDQARHRIAAVAGAHQERQPDPVGFEFLLARVAPECEQPVARDRAADRDRPGHRRGLDRGIEHALASPRALGGMSLHEVAKLMAESRGQLGLVVEPGQQPARDKNVVGQGVGVGARHIENDETIVAARLGDQLLADAIDIGLKGGVGIDRTDFALDLARHRGRAALGCPLAGCRSGRRRLRRTALRGAGGGPNDERDKRQNTAKNH